MNKEELYDLLVNHIKKEWIDKVQKDKDDELDIKTNTSLVLEYDQIRNKGRIDELNDLIEFIEKWD